MLQLLIVAVVVVEVFYGLSTFCICCSLLFFQVEVFCAVEKAPSAWQQQRCSSITGRTISSSNITSISKNLSMRLRRPSPSLSTTQGLLARRIYISPGDICTKMPLSLRTLVYASCSQLRVVRRATRSIGCPRNSAMQTAASLP